MIKLHDQVKPDQAILTKLAKYQKAIDDLPSFEEKRVKAKSAFSSRNKKGNQVFDAVKIKLSELCSGARRCAYCEDNVADEVEHIYPKDIYPNMCFSWDNYVYACGPCNGPKNNKFAIFKHADGQYVEVNTKNPKPVDLPPPGDAVLINPRIEDPMEYCMLDIKDTFKFVIIAEENTREHKRVHYTFNEVLCLNDQREYLRQARMNAYGNYRSRLYTYAHEKNSGAAKAVLDKMIEGIQKEAHPTVWKEMQRYYKQNFLVSFDQQLHQLFTACPEALDW